MYKLLRAGTVNFALYIRKPNPLTLNVKDCLIFAEKKKKIFFSPKIA